MEIQFLREYKSIKSGAIFNLPSFCLLTGKNGSGKTHLLEAMANSSITRITVDGKVLQKIKYIPFNGLIPSIDIECTSEYVNNALRNYIPVFKRLKRSYEEKGYWPYQDALKSNRFEQSNEPPNPRKMDQDQGLLITFLVKRAMEKTSKSISELTEYDIEDAYDFNLVNKDQFLFGNFSKIFQCYYSRKEENNYNEYLQSTGKPPFKDVLSREDFLYKFGEPPWDLVNKIFKETGIPYKVNNPEGNRRDEPFILTFSDIETNVEVKPDDLSTGEKVLLSLVLAIYNITDDVGRPDLLMIDEPDAGLHPSMSKRLISTISDHLVKNNGINTIITTHSPTTVVCSPGNSVFQKNRGEDVPVKISIQEGVELLTADIPFLKISTEERRQVIVESKYDVKYYEGLVNIVSREEKLNSSPIFVPARTSNGSNCEDVKNIVNALCSSGNDQVYGIIDWDGITKAHDNPRLLALGEGERYAIENYLLDPLLMGLLLIRENIISTSDIEGLSIHAYSGVEKINENDAQLVIDYILTRLELLQEEKTCYRVYNDWSLQISRSFNLYQGHSLEDLYKKVFPQLQKYRREDELKGEVIRKIINDYPRLMPMELVNVLRKIV